MARKRYEADEETEETGVPEGKDDRLKTGEKIPEMDRADIGDHNEACPYALVEDEKVCSWCLGREAGIKGVNSTRWLEGWNRGKAE